MPDLILPDEADRCPKCDRVLYVDTPCACGKKPSGLRRVAKLTGGLTVKSGETVVKYDEDGNKK